jgi:hypothetical protein
VSYKRVGPNGAGFRESFDETPASGNGVADAPPARLLEGDEVGPSQTFYGGTGTLASYNYSCGGTGCLGYSGSGNWIIQQGDNYKGEMGYLGLMFQIDGETHYGWALLSVNLGPPPFVTLKGYAYETIANMPIAAGQTKDADDSSALPISLTMPESARLAGCGR